MTPETAIKKQCRDYLRAKGWFVFHVLQGLGCYPGMSDMIAIKKGRVLFIEIKAPKGRQSKYQQQFEMDISTHGGEYVVARSYQDLDAVGA